jgi:Lon protease-like protein
MPGPLLPLFPLSVVLFPRTDLPLHIFEERYKEMVRDVLESNREFGVVLVLEKGIASVGCTARIHEVDKKYEDGRMDLSTVGFRRFEIQDLDEGRSYLRGRVEFFDDEGGGAPEEDLIRKAIRGYYAMRTLEKGRSLPEPVLNDPQLSFQLSQAVTDLNVRQMLLMSRSEAERIRRLAELFPVTAARERRIEYFRTIVPRNGHGKLLPGA